MTKDIKDKLVDSRLDGMLGGKPEPAPVRRTYSYDDDPLYIPPYLDRRSPMRDDVYDMGRAPMRRPVERVGGHVPSSGSYSEPFRSSIDKQRPRFGEHGQRLMNKGERAAIGVAVWRVLLDAYSAVGIVLDPVDIAAYRREFIEINDELLMGAMHQGLVSHKPIEHEDAPKKQNVTAEYYSDPDGSWRSLVVDEDGVVIGERGGFDALDEAKAWASDLIEKANGDNRKEGDHVEYG